MKRLVSFLGTGDYEATCYAWDGVGEYKTSYASEAIAALWHADEIRILATVEARKRHEAALRERLHALDIGIDMVELPDGREQTEQWQQFRTLQHALDGDGGVQVLLDITHGFRAQPFMAGAALAVRRALAPEQALPGVVYAEYRKSDASGRVWSLNLFTEIVDWSHALGLFQHTGVSGPLIAHARRERDRQAARTQAAGARDFPTFDPLVKAIEAFAGDLATVRVASIITGYEQDDARKHKARSSAALLCEAITQCRDDVERRLPALALALDRLEREVRPLIATRLHGTAGQDALAALARRYLQLERYPEAAIVAREARVNRHAYGAAAVEVNAPGFDKVDRQGAEGRFATRDGDARGIADVRNDIGHGGFREQPLDAATLQRQIGKLVNGLVDGLVPARSASAGKILFVSRHPGAQQWAREERVQVDEIVAHLDLEQVDPGDTVIGSLPVNLAAAVCARGARYLHLALELPAALRGSELSADELRALGATLIEYRIGNADSSLG